MSGSLRTRNSRRLGELLRIVSAKSVARALLVAALTVGWAQRADAQLVPDARWRTIRTAHFRITFTPELAEQAQRAASNAERAYAGLSRELVPPRGTIDLVLTDNADYVNGYATPFPTNRIVVYAHPSTDAQGLRNYSDWNELVVTHELTHIFHLDRARGVWRLGQRVFGRNPLLFPNLYDPGWVTEGLAVYYESRLTGVGRLESGEHFMAARATALAKEVPRLDQLSRGTSRFPGGEVAYIYGSLLFDYLSRTTSPSRVRDFVEKSSAFPLPLFLNHNAKAAFGISFETAWKRWRDSLFSHLPSDIETPGWRELTSTGRTAIFPRWQSDSVIWYAGNKGREVPALYAVDLRGRERNLGRRNSLGANVSLADGSILFSQADLTSPYEERIDLWTQRGTDQIQLTRAARLHSPDVRSGGAIVAVQNAPASTRLVRVSSDGKSITALTQGTLDLQWADPRWSPDGSRIVAVELSRGSSAIVLLDSTGRELTRFASSTAITASPSWSRDGKLIFFSSERSGSSQLYVAALDQRPVVIRRLTAVATGIFYPEPSPDGRLIAASLYGADGYHIGVFPVPEFSSLPLAEPAPVSPRGDCPACVVPPLELLRAVAAGTQSPIAARNYSVFPAILPSYWLPIFQSSSDNGSGFGGETSGGDIVGRHSYDAQLVHNTTHGENSARLYYRYAGLGMPWLGAAASQSYSRAALFAAAGGKATVVGALVERSRVASLQTIFIRSRLRHYFSVSLGGEVERKSYVTEPDTLLGHVSSFFRRASTYPALFVTGNWSNARRPGLSISPEDGLSFSGTLRERWRSGSSVAPSRSAVAALSAFKSLDLPGFAHHVLALRAAGGIADERASSRFSAGGVSGSSLALFSIYGGGQQRTFGARGYPAGSEQGIRAAAATAEYRVPLFAPSRGFRFFPLFVDRVSATVFGDAARAYCPAAASNGSGICVASNAGNPWMSSAGAELIVDTGIQADFGARLRFGVAFPLANRGVLSAPGSLFYVTFGSAF